MAVSFYPTQLGQGNNSVQGYLHFIALVQEALYSKKADSISTVKSLIQENAYFYKQTIAKQFPFESMMETLLQQNHPDSFEKAVQFSLILQETKDPALNTPFCEACEAASLLKLDREDGLEAIKKLSFPREWGTFREFLESRLQIYQADQNLTLIELFQPLIHKLPKVA